MDNETGHSILCAWPYRPCVAFCEHLDGWESRKFSAPLAERLWTLTLDSNQDAEIGEAEGFGWFALFERDLAMLSVDAQGFVGVAVYESLPDAHAAWADLGRQYNEHHTRAVVDALDTSACDDLYQIVYVHNVYNVGGLASLDDITEHVNTHRECHDRNAWALDA